MHKNLIEIRFSAIILVVDSKTLSLGTIQQI